MTWSNSAPFHCTASQVTLNALNCVSEHWWEEQQLMGREISRDPVHFAGSSPSPANRWFYSSYKAHFISCPWKIPSTSNKSCRRKSLVGVSTREAISIDRLNDTESMVLQPFTPGLNISKLQEETNSAHSYGYVCACHLQWSRNSCYTTFWGGTTSLCLEWDSLPSIRCRQKQNITFTYDFTRGRKLKSALLLPQEEGACYMPPGHEGWQQFCQCRIRIPSPLLPKEIRLLGHLTYLTGRPFLLKLLMHTKACAQQ